MLAKSDEDAVVRKLKTEGLVESEIRDEIAAIKRQKNLPLPHFSSLVISSWDEYQKRFWIFVLILLLPLSVNIPFYFLPQDADLLYSLLNVYEIFGLSTLVFVLFLACIYFIFTVVASQLSRLAIYSVIFLPNTASARKAYREALPKLAGYVWISVLSAIIIIGSLALFIIPAIIFSVWFSFSGFVYFNEDARGQDALAKSREIVRGYAWQIFLLFLLFGISAFLVYIVLTSGLEAILSLVFQGRDLSIITLDIMPTAFGLLIVPLFLIFSKRIYEHILYVKENISLASIQGNKKMIRNSALAGWVLVVFSGIFLSYFIYSGYRFLLGEKITTRNIDTFTIRVPLEKYKRANASYPENLRALIPDYADKLPATFREEENFSYTVIGDGVNYEICVSYEEDEKECFTGSENGS